LNCAISISGFGGQGVLFIGRLLIESGFSDGKEVTWLPYYSGEKRGGMCSCFVNISDRRIGSIFITRPDIGVAMNSIAMRVLDLSTKSGGTLMVNKSLINSQTQRKDVKVVYVPTVETAKELGDESVANLVMLGALIASTSIIKPVSIINVLDQMLSKNRRQLDLNKEAFNRGYVFS
jgi:2-oxoglutarate ferredoxin oxidoreductase subunit gamma